LFLQILSILMSTFQIGVLKCLGALYFVMKMPDISLGLTNLFLSDSVEFNIVSELNILIDIVYLLHFLHWFLPTLIWLHMIMRPGYTSCSFVDWPWLHPMVWPHMTIRPGYTSWSYDDWQWLHPMVWPHMAMRPGYTSWSYDTGPWLHFMVWPHMTMRPGYTSWSYDTGPWLHSMVW